MSPEAKGEGMEVEVPEPAENGAENAEEERGRVEAAVEAVLFSTEIPLPAKKIAVLVRATKRDVLETIDRLNVFYGETGRAFRVAALAGGFQMVTMPEHAELLGKLHKERTPSRLSRAALETLSIIAFKQPVTRAEIDSIRGVSASDSVLRHLIERKLVRISGRAEAPGRPLLYGTTREFLGYFGLSTLSDLPRTDELNALLAGEVPRNLGVDESTGELVEVGEPLEEDLPRPEEAERIESETEVAMSHSGEESDPRDGTDPT